MDIKFNINKIHGDLLNLYNEVSIKEGANEKWGQFFELEIKNEGKTLRCLITKESIMNPSFNWGYFGNPLLENSHLVARQSDIYSFVNHIEDIFTKERFDKDYLKTIKS